MRWGMLGICQLVNKQNNTRLMEVLCMNNTEFQQKLEKMYADNPMIAGSSRKTFNTLVFLLRQDDVDYNISIPPYKEDMGWLCIPSVKETFIPVKTLAMHVKEVRVDELENDDFEYNGVCLTVYLEE